MRFCSAALMAALLVLAAGSAFADTELSSPGFPPSTVDASGALQEPWGSVFLQLIQPEGAAPTSQQTAPGAVPTVITTKTAGPVSLVETAYRAPIWPSGADVLQAKLANTAADTVEVCLEVLVPDSMSIGETAGVVNGTPVLALPQGVTPVRKERAWGCTGGVVAMPGWAHPNRDCDPAFKNISAGMGGVPIVYRFAVPVGENRTIALGFCESHWNVPAYRLLAVAVEGAPPRNLDPIAEWGQHGPGCLVFDAADANQDARIEIAVNPHPNAADRNPILNVIWIFPAGTAVDPEQAISGALTPSAECYVDVGGPNDQLLYEAGQLKYNLTLAPGENKELLFLLASPGCEQLPDPSRMTWTAHSLRKAAEDVARN